MDPNAHAFWRKYTCDDITTLSYDPTTEIHIPFRAVVNHKHHTWAKTYFSKPDLYIKPSTLKEIKLVVALARQCKKKIIVVGSGHSPSDMTCANTGSWMVNLDDFDEVVRVDREKLQITVEAGIRLHGLESELTELEWAMPNLGSIWDQSIAGAIATGTHGSSLQHGLLSRSVVDLTLMTSSGELVTASANENSDLYHAALVSLGGFGIITHVTFQAVPAFKLAWKQEILTLPHMLENWQSKTLWESAEFVRVWWFPYSARTIAWYAERTDEEVQDPPYSWYGTKFGHHAYQFMLYIARWIPTLTPWVERTIFRLQYGWDERVTGQAVQKSSDALRMDCLFSQHVNEWAIPLHRGPEAITRFQAWLSHDLATAGIPFSPTGIFVHAPIEVRVSNSSRDAGLNRRALLDPGCDDGPSLYLNATLYRPYLSDIPSRITYYKAFEYLMKELGGRPHWAKNWITVGKEDFRGMYGERMEKWVWMREEMDKVGMFRSAWLERNLLGSKDEVREREKEVQEKKRIAVEKIEEVDVTVEKGKGPLQPRTVPAVGTEKEKENEREEDITLSQKLRAAMGSGSDDESEDSRTFEKMSSSTESFAFVQHEDESGDDDDDDDDNDEDEDDDDDEEERRRKF